MVGALLFIFLVIVIVLFACVVVLMFQTLQPTYIVDLAEFRDLHPTVKRFYKQYLVDIVIAALVSRTNMALVELNVPKSLKDKEAQVKAAAEQAARDIMTTPTSSLMATARRASSTATAEGYDDMYAAASIDDNYEAYEDGPALGTVLAKFRDSVMAVVSLA